MSVILSARDFLVTLDIWRSLVVTLNPTCGPNCPE